jgi:hypothetical protein
MTVPAVPTIASAPNQVANTEKEAMPRPSWRPVLM